MFHANLTIKSIVKLIVNYKKLYIIFSYNFSGSMIVARQFEVIAEL